MIISVTNIKSKENREFKCNNVVYKATEKLTKGAFTVVPCKNCLGVSTKDSVPELFGFLGKYGYKF